MINDITTHVIDPCTSEQWAELAQTGDLFHSPPWLRVLRDSFGVEPSAVLLDRAGADTQAGLPFCRIEDLVGKRISTLPFSDFSGPLGVTSDQDWHALLSAVLDMGAPFRIRTVHDERLTRDDRLEHIGRAKWHVVELASDPDETWGRLASSARQNIRRAKRNGLEVTVSSEPSAMAQFEDLHLGLRRQKYGMLSQPPEFFQSLVEHFAGDHAVVIASSEGVPVASILLLRWGNRAYYKFNASRVEALSTRANDLVMWEAIDYATTQWQCKLLDLGLSDIDQPGLIRYKSKYAAIEGEIETFRSKSPDESSLSAEARTLAANVAALTAAEGSPDDLCRSISSHLYKYFC